MATWRYELYGWRRIPTAPSLSPGFKLRPGPRTLLLRLRITVAAAILLASLLWLSTTVAHALDPPPPLTTLIATPDDPKIQRAMADLYRAMSPARRKLVEQRVAQQDAARQRRRADHAARKHACAAALRWTTLLLSATLALAGTAAPLSTLWNRLLVTCPQPGLLTLTETGLWPRTRSIPLAHYARPVLAQYQFTTQGTARTPDQTTWVWVYVLRPTPPTQAPQVEFWLQPSSTPSTPFPDHELTEFVRPFESLTGLSTHPTSSPNNSQFLS